MGSDEIQVKSVMIMKSYYESISKIKDDALKCKIYESICKYAFLGEEPDEEADVIIQALFQSFKPTIDESLNSYRNKVERNRQNGAKGGRPKKDEKPNG